MINKVVVNDLVGIPFHNRGRDANGLDCWGLFQIVQERFGNHVPDVDVSAYSTPGIADVVSRQINDNLWEKVDSPEPGDAVIMSLDNDYKDVAQHVGVYIGNGMFIHTLEKMGTVYVSIKHPFWKNRIRGFYRWIGR